MPNISSRWKLTWDPTGINRVILNFGEILEDELEFPVEQAVDVVPLVDSTAPFLRAAGNASFNLDFSFLTSAATDTLARNNAIEVARINAGLGRKPIKLEYMNDAGLIASKWWEFSGALIKSVRGKVVFVGASPRWREQWSIVATGLSVKP